MHRRPGRPDAIVAPLGFDRPAVERDLDPASGQAPDEEKIISALSDKLAKFKLPKRVYQVDALPRNTMGKVQKAELRAKFADTFGAK